MSVWPDYASVVPYDPAWPRLFAALGASLRRELGAVALRIDHIGSTSVPALAAKPIVDVQISVAALEPVDRYRGRPWRGPASSGGPTTPNGPSAISVSATATGARTSTSDARARSRSRSRCCSVTIYGPIPTGPSATRPRSAGTRTC